MPTDKSPKQKELFDKKTIESVPLGKGLESSFQNEPQKDAMTDKEVAARNSLEHHIQAAKKEEAKLTKEIEDRQARRNQVTKRKKLLEDLNRYSKKDWQLHIKQRCEKEATFLKNLRESKHSSILEIEEVYKEAKTKTDSILEALPRNLDQSAENANLTLDRIRSRHPRYYFGEHGFIEVQVIDSRQTARLSTREGRLAEIPADAPAIIDGVQSEVKRLFGRKFKGDNFLQVLHSTYKATLKKMKAHDGSPVPAREVFDAMTSRKAYKKYKADEFLVDLSQLVEKGPESTKGYRFELQQTKDTENGMLLLGKAGRGMVNLLIFKKQEINTP